MNIYLNRTVAHLIKRNETCVVFQTYGIESEGNFTIEMTIDTRAKYTLKNALEIVMPPKNVKFSVYLFSPYK